MKANLKDLTSVLFEMVERVNDDELKGSELSEQVQKAKTINDIAETIVKIGDLQLKAVKLGEESCCTVPKMLIGEAT